MTVPRLQGWFDEIKPSIDSLVKTLPQILNPNKDFQLKMREHLAANPHLAQQYADLLKNDPEIFNRMGLTNVTNYVQNLPESSGQKAEKRKAQVLSSTTTPEEDIDIRAGILGTQRPISREQEQVNLATSKLDQAIKSVFSRYASTIYSADAAKAEKSLRDMSTELAQTPIAINAFNTIAGNYENVRKLTPKEYAIVSSHPETVKGFEKLRDDYWIRYKANLDKRLSRENREALIEAQMYATWAREIVEYGGVDPGAALRFIQVTPGEQETLYNLTTPPPDPETAQLWRTGQAIKKLTKKRELSILDSITDEVKKFAGVGLAAVAKKMNTASLQALNAGLEIAATNLNLPVIPVFEYKRSGLLGGKTLVLKQGDLHFAKLLTAETGLEVITPEQDAKDAQAATITSDPSRIDQEAQNIANILNSMQDSDARQRWLDSWAAQEHQEIVKEIRKVLPKYLNK